MMNDRPGMTEERFGHGASIPGRIEDRQWLDRCRKTFDLIDIKYAEGPHDRSTGFRLPFLSNEGVGIRNPGGKKDHRCRGFTFPDLRPDLLGLAIRQPSGHGITIEIGGHTGV